MLNSETIRCPFCVDGEWYKRRDYKEPYGDMYRPVKIPCGVCHGSKAILESEVSNHPEKQKITEKERSDILKKMKEKEIAKRK